MTNPTPASANDADVARRLAELEAENEQLRSRLDETPDRPDRVSRPRKGTWRGVLSSAVIVVAALLVPVSIVSAWARTELVDETAFVATFAPLAQDPAVQALIVDEATVAIDESLDLQGLTDDLFDGLGGLGLPPRATAAIDLLRGPAVEGLRGLIGTSVTQLVESDVFASVWETALRASHRGLAAAATGTTPTGAVTISDTGEVGISLAPIIDEVKERLVAQGVGFASAVPSVDRTIVLVQSDALVTVRIVYGIAAAVGWWLPLVTLALFVGGVLLARRKSVALVGTGVAIALGGGALAVALAIGATVASIAASQLALPITAVDAIYEQIITAMRDTAAVIALIGVLLAILAWVQGRSTAAIAIRTGAAGINHRLRSTLRSSGADTGRVGRWIYTYRVLVRVALAALVILWLLTLRPLSIGDVSLVLIVALLAWWATELAQSDAVDDEPARAEPELSAPEPSAPQRVTA
ncbi:MULTISPECIES: hypothetical protein [Bacteria]